MSNTATGVLKDALKDAEAARDRVAKDTEATRAEGARAQALVDAAQQRVDDLIEALDKLNRPEPAVWPVSDHQAELPEMRDGFDPHRPDTEELVVGGVGITRRRAE